jgi:hypothetical protein
MLRRPSLRSQLNQIRLWVRQGRTDAWIAHKLDITVEQLDQFKRDHGLDGQTPQPESSEPVEAVPEPDLEDELLEEQLAAAEAPPQEVAYEDGDEDEDEEREAEEPRRRRRRGRRGGRRRGARRTDSYEGTFDHGAEGYGLWLDPAVADNQAYADHWAGHRAVVVTIEPDAITIRRAGEEGSDEDGEEDE